MKLIVAGISLAAALAGSTGDTRLADAAMQGDPALVRSMLQQKADVNAAQGDGMTALHWAAYHSDLSLVKVLLGAGADFKAATRQGGITPMFLACSNGDAAVIAALLDAGDSPNSANENGTTALMTAAAAGNPDAVKVLLNHGADVKAREKAHGQTALMFAAALNRASVVKLLLAGGAEPNALSTSRAIERVRFDQDGNIVETPAGRGGRGGAGAGAPRGTARGGGGTVPMTAQEADKADAAADAAAAEDASKAAREAARTELDLLGQAMGFKSAAFLLGKPRTLAGDVAARAPRRVGPEFAGGMTALLYAAREGHMDTVCALVEAGADVNLLSADKFSPMVEAIANGHLDIGKYLLEHGADPNPATSQGLTALYAVIDVQWAPHTWFPQPTTEQEQTNYLDLMKMLLDHGAHVNAAISDKLWFRSYTNDYTWVDPAGSTPFWRAAQSSDAEAMRLLMKYGADPKKPTPSGDTPLMAAAGIGWAANWSVNAPQPLIDAVKYCVELGNDVNAADNRGYTALHGAAYLGNADMIKYLVEKGAHIKARSKAGDTVADMANGPTRFGQPHPEAVALLEKLGSDNSHNCRSDQCVVQAGATIYNRPLTAAEQVEKDNLDHFAKALGFQSAEYLADGPPVRRPGGN